MLLTSILRHSLHNLPKMQGFNRVFLLISFLCTWLSSFVVYGTLKDVTSSVLGTHTKGIIASFGDFNADKNCDVFEIKDDGKSITVLLATDENSLSPELKKSFTEVVLLNKTKSSRADRITNVVPADFDGDSQMDVLVMWQKESSKSTSVDVFWGKDHKTLEPDAFTIAEKFTDQPLIFDYNGDLIPDLLGQTENGETSVYLSRSKDRNFTLYNFTEQISDLKSELSGYVDLNNDLNADLCLGRSAGLDLFYNHNGYFRRARSLPFPNIKVIGKPSFIDFDKDGSMDILLPGCKNENCSDSSIYINKGSQWTKLAMDLSYKGTQWKLSPLSLGTIGEIPMTLRMGDFNFDGYPDILTVLSDSEGKQMRATLIRNKKCLSGCGGLSRSLAVDWSASLHDENPKAVTVAFYDYLENGILDVILSTHTQDSGYKTNLWKQDFTEDASFIKVMVTSGVCFESCPYGRKPYGINQPGPVVHYKMLDTDGKPHEGIASQLSQTSYLSLQLPYVVFGLGHTPNFIDDLTVGISQTNDSMESRQKTWKSVIPNSQLIIIPYPHSKPSKWINKLFVTPSHLVLLTGISLLGTCGFLAIITGILHWRERVEDKKEKLQEAHKFHFDAM